MNRLLNRIHHLSVTNDAQILIYGGFHRQTRHQFTGRQLDILNAFTCKSRPVRCTGKAPRGVVRHQDAVAQVLNNKLYVFVEQEWFVLNLGTFHWEPLEDVSGVPPLKGRFYSSWTWCDKIYIFGGFTRSSTDNFTLVSPEQDEVSFFSDGFINQCVAFNTTMKTWEWPRISGERVPQSQKQQLCFAEGDYVILVSSEKDNECKPQLYSLHLPSHTWKTLETPRGCLGPDINQDTCGHMLTHVGSGKAHLFSRNCSSIVWVLHWSQGEQGIRDVYWNYFDIVDETRLAPYHLSGDTVVYCAATAGVYHLCGYTSDKSYTGFSFTQMNPPSLLCSSMYTLAMNKKKFDFEQLRLPGDLRQRMLGIVTDFRKGFPRERQRQGLRRRQKRALKA